MTPGSAKHEFMRQELVNEQPVRFHMAVTPADPIPAKRMIPVFNGKWLSGDLEIDRRFQRLKILAPLPLRFEILSKPVGLRDLHDSQDA